MTLSQDFVVRKTNMDCIESRDDLSEAISIFKDVLKYYLEMNNNYSKKIYDINDYEKVIVFEDSVIVYVGLKYFERIMPYGHIRTVYDNYTIVFQELLSNEFYKFKKKTLLDHYSHNYKWEERMAMKYKIFNGDIYDYVWNNYRGTFDVFESNFDYVDKKLPELKLKDRYFKWKGWKYYFIVYELEYDGKKGYYMIHTQNDNPYKFAHTNEKYVEEEMRMYVFGWADEELTDETNENVVSLKDAYNYYFLYNFSKYLVDETTGKARQDVKRVGDYDYFLDGVVKYYVVPQYIKNKGDLFKYQKIIFDNVVNEKYDNYERQVFNAKDYAWKSELLMFNCIKRIFKNKTVIHQYNPYFLGQMSYDVYVCGEEIAFEYQGKQHFEPVEYFGGEEAHKKQVERDQKKKELSEQNGVKLIYVNYWEDITVELIKQKIKESENE